MNLQCISSSHTQHMPLIEPKPTVGHGHTMYIELKLEYKRTLRKITPVQIFKANNIYTPQRFLNSAYSIFVTVIECTEIMQFILINYSNI